MLFLIIAHIHKRHMDQPIWSKSSTYGSAKVQAFVNMLSEVVQNDRQLQDYLVLGATTEFGKTFDIALGVNRAVVAYLACRTETLEGLLSRAIEQFGDQLYISQTPIVRQDGGFCYNFIVTHAATDRG